MQQRKECPLEVEEKQEIFDSQSQVKKVFKNEDVICCMKCCLSRMRIDHIFSNVEMTGDSEQSYFSRILGTKYCLEWIQGRVGERNWRWKVRKTLE